ncbi:Aspyridones efflux protein apdF [Zalerion maritima]|uniref:Aspyridones efflux protein apdF n=1 Tax=Zalerion maritima TaxID=339359 RepID=A0AAD5RHH9_9PEZI|nr:Aspyridones efflux protein apdF [Zalerion maritima]
MDPPTLTPTVTRTSTTQQVNHDPEKPQDPIRPPIPSIHSLRDGDSDNNDGTPTYPEGGLEGWAVVFGAWCGLIASFGIMNSIGAFQDYISFGPLRDYSDGAVGWISSIHVFLAFFGGILFGPVFDTHGPRWLILLGSILLVASMMLLSICQEYWQFMLSLGVLGGIGSSLIFIPAFTAPGHYFLKKRGTATGLATSGGSVGGVIFPIVLEKLIPTIGFPWAVRVLGFIVLGLVVFANLLIRTRLPPKRGATSMPNFKIFRQPAFTCITASLFLMEMALFVPLSYIISYSIAEGIDTSLAYQLLSILNGSSIVGRALCGIAADVFGRFNTLTFFVFICLTSIAGLWLPAHGLSSIMVVYAAVFGFASGSNISLAPVCIGQLCRIEDYGRYYATSYSVASFGTLIGIPIAGNILEAANGEYWGMIVFAIAGYVGAFVTAAMGRGLASNWKITTVY